MSKVDHEPMGIDLGNGVLMHKGNGGDTRGVDEIVARPEAPPQRSIPLFEGEEKAQALIGSGANGVEEPGVPIIPFPGWKIKIP